MNVLKFLILMSLLVTQAHAYIMSCPTVADLKNHEFHEWQPIYKDIEELASDEDVGKFIDAITALEAGWWQPMFLEAGHCDYTGINSNAEKITLSHDAWRPVAADNWQWITQDKLAVCRPTTSQASCEFIT